MTAVILPSTVVLLTAVTVPSTVVLLTAVTVPSTVVLLTAVTVPSISHYATGMANLKIQCGICFCIADAGWQVDITQAVYSQVPVQILLHYSAVMTLRAGKLLPVLEKHPLHATQMQAILRLKAECRAQIVYSVWWQSYRMAYRATVAILARTGNVSPSPKHPDQSLGPTTFC